MTDELKKLANVPVEHPFGGRTFQLTPMKLLAAQRAQEIVEPFIAEMAESEVNVTRLMMRHSTRLHELVIVMLAGTNAQAQAALSAWFESLDDDPEYESLLAKLIEVNEDFFARRVQSLAVASLRAKIGSSKYLGTSPTGPSQKNAEPAGPTP